MSDRKEFRDLATVGEARDAIDSLRLGGGTETVPLADARGRVLAERVDAALDVPGFDRASMDGYAVRARDTFGAGETDPARLEGIGSVQAGETPEVSVEPGTTAEISTGAVMSDGADAVVMVERAREGDDAVLIETAVTPGENVMLAGADVAAGERALGPVTRVTPREIGLLSALGVEDVPVRARPRVAIVSTGDELVRPGGDLDSEAGQIYDVNSHAIGTAVEEAGGEPVYYPHVGDDTDEMERVLTEAADACDLVLSSGSTSASAADVVYRVIDRRGELLLHGIAVKPGKPTIVGRLGDAAYVGLPGYPVSALTVFRTFVAPAIRDAAGLPEPRTATVTGEMAIRERFAEGRRRLVPVGLVGTGPDDDDRMEGPTGEGPKTLVYPVDKGSGATTSLTEADGVVAVPADVDGLAAGERVTVDLFSPDVRPPTLLGVGEDDPALSRLLDRLDGPRYLSQGTRIGLRRLREGVPDVAVVAGPREDGIDGESEDAIGAAELGGWTREWGLVIPTGNPDNVAGLVDLVDRELRFVNRGSDSGLRASLVDALEELAADRGVARADLTAAIDGYDLTARAFESPARKVAAGEADAGLGLRATAATLDLGFVTVGTERVRVLANPDRTGKASVRDLEAELDDVGNLLEDLDGFTA